MYILFIFVFGIFSLLSLDLFYQKKLKNLISSRNMQKMLTNVSGIEKKEEYQKLLKEANEEVDDFMRSL